jgi:hypothetical protein
MYMRTKQTTFRLFLHICGTTIQGSTSAFSRGDDSLIVVSANLVNDAWLRCLCQRGGGRFLCPRDPLLAPLCDLCTLLRNKYRRPLIPPMCPISKITESEHRDEVSSRICSHERAAQARITRRNSIIFFSKCHVEEGVSQRCG